MARIPCFLYHSLRLSRDARWGNAYRATRRPEADAPLSLRGRRGDDATTATVIRLEDRRQNAGG